MVFSYELFMKGNPLPTLKGNITLVKRFFLELKSKICKWCIEDTRYRKQANKNSNNNVLV
jgi:hypothetical protein